MRAMRVIVAVVLASGVVMLSSERSGWGAGTPAEEAAKTLASRQLSVVENLVSARAAYRKSLEAVVSFYEATGDSYKLKLAREELAGLKEVPQAEYVTVAEALLEAKAAKETPGANRLLEDAEHYSKLSETADRKKNSELALERCLDLMRRYPESDRIDDAAYLAGRIYQSPMKAYHSAMVYYEKCYQWNAGTTTDARIRAARMAYRLHELAKAKTLYEEARKNSPGAADRNEAEAKLTVLKAMGY